MRMLLFGNFYMNSAEFSQLIKKQMSELNYDGNCYFVCQWVQYNRFDVDFDLCHEDAIPN